MKSLTMKFFFFYAVSIRRHEKTSLDWLKFTMLLFCENSSLKNSLP